MVGTNNVEKLQEKWQQEENKKDGFIANTFFRVWDKSYRDK